MSAPAPLLPVATPRAGYSPKRVPLHYFALVFAASVLALLFITDLSHYKPPEKPWVVTRVDALERYLASFPPDDMQANRQRAQFKNNPKVQMVLSPEHRSTFDWLSTQTLFVFGDQCAASVVPPSDETGAYSGDPSEDAEPDAQLTWTDALFKSLPPGKERRYINYAGNGSVAEQLAAFEAGAGHWDAETSLFVVSFGTCALHGLENVHWEDWLTDEASAGTKAAIRLYVLGARNFLFLTDPGYLQAQVATTDDEGVALGGSFDTEAVAAATDAKYRLAVVAWYNHELVGAVHELEALQASPMLFDWHALATMYEFRNSAESNYATSRLPAGLQPRRDNLNEPLYDAPGHLTPSGQEYKIRALDDFLYRHSHTVRTPPDDRPGATSAD